MTTKRRSIIPLMGIDGLQHEIGANSKYNSTGEDYPLPNRLSLLRIFM